MQNPMNSLTRSKVIIEDIGGQRVGKFQEAKGVISGSKRS